MPRHRFAAVVGVVWLVLAATACGGGGDTAGVATLSDGSDAKEVSDADGSEKSFEDALLEYTRCMREQGIDMPDPEKGESGEIFIGEPQVEGGGTNEGGGAMVEAAPIAGAPVEGHSMEEFEEADGRCSHLLPESATLSPEEEAEMQDRMLEFATCMREHGVDMPDPRADGVQVGITIDMLEDPVFQKAQEACGDFLPGEGFTTVEER